VGVGKKSPDGTPQGTGDNFGDDSGGVHFAQRVPSKPKENFNFVNKKNKGKETYIGQRRAKICGWKPKKVRGGAGGVGRRGKFDKEN